MQSRKLEDLHPRAEELARLLLADSKKQLGVRVIVTSTRRFYEEQEALYAIGRTEALGRRIVTKSPPGYSWHEYGLAFDVAPIVGGKAVYGDRKLFSQIGALGESLGLRWGGDGGFIAAGIEDMPHFELTSGLKIGTALWLYEKKGGLGAVWAEVDRLVALREKKAA